MLLINTMYVCRWWDFCHLGILCHLSCQSSGHDLLEGTAAYLGFPPQGRAAETTWVLHLVIEKNKTRHQGSAGRGGRGRGAALRRVVNLEGCVLVRQTRPGPWTLKALWEAGEGAWEGGRHRCDRMGEELDVGPARRGALWISSFHPQWPPSITLAIHLQSYFSKVDGLLETKWSVEVKRIVSISIVIIIAY